MKSDKAIKFHENNIYNKINLIIYNTSLNKLVLSNLKKIHDT